MVLFGGALTQLGQCGIALPPVAIDANDEKHQQRRDQEETDVASRKVQPQRIGLQRSGQGQWHTKECQQHHRQHRYGRDHPAPVRRQQDRADHDLQQEQERERVGRPPGQIQLPGQRHHIEHQRADQFDIAVARTFRPHRMGCQIDQRQERRDSHQLRQRQDNAQFAAGKPDRHQLADHGHPAQLQQQRHVAGAGRGIDHGRGRGGGREIHYRRRFTTIAPAMAIAPMVNQVSA